LRLPNLDFFAAFFAFFAMTVSSLFNLWG